MKIASDDHKAKIRPAVRFPQPCTPAEAEGFPPLTCKRFSGYEELNAWKRECRREIARAGGLRWKS